MSTDSLRARIEQDEAILAMAAHADEIEMDVTTAAT